MLTDAGLKVVAGFTELDEAMDMLHSAVITRPRPGLAARDFPTLASFSAGDVDRGRRTEQP